MAAGDPEVLHDISNSDRERIWSLVSVSWPGISEPITPDLMTRAMAAVASAEWPVRMKGPECRLVGGTPRAVAAGPIPFPAGP